jgi:hypothetical protein
MFNRECILILPNEAKVSTMFGIRYVSGLVTAFKDL